MTADQVIDILRPLGSASYKKVMLAHGVQEPFFGVKIADLKTLQKQIKTDYPLALALYDTGNYDAMYLAGLITDDAKMTRKDLTRWVTKANCPALADYTVAWVAAGGPHGFDLALEWIEAKPAAKKELIAAAGWSTLSNLVALRPDAELDLKQFRQLIARVQKNIHAEPNRVRSAMNRFLIAVGSYVTSLTDTVLAAAAKIGDVEVDVGDTACKVPSAADAIAKVKSRGAIGKKRKMVKC